MCHVAPHLGTNRRSAVSQYTEGAYTCPTVQHTPSEALVRRRPKATPALVRRQSVIGVDTHFSRRKNHFPYSEVGLKIGADMNTAESGARSSLYCRDCVTWLDGLGLNDYTPCDIVPRGSGVN
ncbi:hypothetical protein F2P81_005291 [Scophthalmus maximus]|uniref:Uncharacterized protein n=1 Tax=Scophthalmus maximus TaxID=52904 RepID=A0A6A4TA71_SCOMX|nr:hypothetical protein F2P81_005291 [Scophthalmus maximus]